jgi:hypothetical protein
MVASKLFRRESVVSRGFVGIALTDVCVALVETVASRFDKLSCSVARVFVHWAVDRAVEDGAREEIVASKLFRRESVVSSGFVGIELTDVCVARVETVASRLSRLPARVFVHCAVDSAVEDGALLETVVSRLSRFAARPAV